MWQTSRLISSMVKELVIDKMSSLLRHDISEQHSLLDCLWDQNDTLTFDF